MNLHHHVDSEGYPSRMGLILAKFRHVERPFYCIICSQRPLKERNKKVVSYSKWSLNANSNRLI